MASMKLSALTSQCLEYSHTMRSNSAMPNEVLDRSNLGDDNENHRFLHQTIFLAFVGAELTWGLRLYFHETRIFIAYQVDRFFFLFELIFRPVHGY